jgi:tRNA threonylcarbamoyladenosine biosynthesis protein TsaE
VYLAPLPLIHVDVYRLLDSGKAALFLDDLDLDTDRENCVTVVEWGGAESARLSDQRLEITIDRSQEVRGVSFNCVGERWAGFSV